MDIRLTVKCTGMFEEQRGVARLKLAEILIAGVNEGTCAHKCGWTSKHAFAYVKQLEREGLWPAKLADIPISNALELADMMPDPVPEESFDTPCTYKYKHAAPAYRRSRGWRLGSFNDSIGICLNCARLGSMYSSCSQH